MFRPITLGRTDTHAPLKDSVEDNAEELKPPMHTIHTDKKRRKAKARPISSVIFDSRGRKPRWGRKNRGFRPRLSGRIKAPNLLPFLPAHFCF
jgi:hypothetical protein